MQKFSRDSTYDINSKTGETILKIQRMRYPIKNSNWISYNQNGDIIKVIKYSKGKLIKEDD